MERLLRTRFAPPIPSGVSFGRDLRLLGLGLAPRPAAPGQVLRLDTYWEALDPFDGQFEVSFVFAGAGGRFDSQRRPLSPRIPPTEWLPGETVREAFAIEVPTGTSPGRYQIRLRVRETGAARPLRVWRSGMPTPSREADLGILEVVPG